MRNGIILSALLLVSAVTGIGVTSGTLQSVAETEIPMISEKTLTSSLNKTEVQSNETVKSSEGPVVYMTTDISSEGLISVYKALNASPSGNIAVKLSTGEPGSNYLKPELIGGLIGSFDNPTIVECNTAYGGARANTAMHYQVAEEHGYTNIANVDIMD